MKHFLSSRSETAAQVLWPLSCTFRKSIECCMEMTLHCSTSQATHVCHVWSLSAFLWDNISQKSKYESSIVIVLEKLLNKMW